MTPEQISAAASQLYQAELSARQCGLISTAHPGMSLVDAYGIQSAYVQLKKSAGASAIGWKIGLTNRTMQRWHNVKTPNFGVLLDDLVLNPGDTVPAGRLVEPRVGVVIGFFMKADLEGSSTARSDVVAATDFIVPALEILDTHTKIIDPDAGERRLVTDSVADNTGTAGVVLGMERHLSGSFDLRWVGAILKLNGVVEETGLGSGILGDPVESIVWLVRRLAAQGEGLKTGDLVLSGSFIRPIEAPKGSAFEIDFGKFGRINLNFS